MALVMAAGCGSFASMALAFHGKYFIAGIAGGVASVLWHEAWRQGRESTRLFAEASLPE